MFISLSDPASKFSSILEKVNECLKRVLLCFNLNMDNFKFNFLSRGQLESLSVHTFLALFKILPWHEVFLVT